MVPILEDELQSLATCEGVFTFISAIYCYFNHATGVGSNKLCIGGRDTDAVYDKTSGYSAGCASFGINIAFLG